MDIAAEVLDGSLPRGQRAIEPHLERHVPCHRQSELTRHRDDRVIDGAREPVVDLHKVVSCGALAYELRAHGTRRFEQDVVGMRQRRRLDDRPGGDDAWPDEAPRRDARAKREVACVSRHVPDGRDAVGDVREQVALGVEVHVHVGEARREEAAGPVHHVGTGGDSDVGSRSDRRVPSVVRHDRLIGNETPQPDVDDAHVCDRERRRTWHTAFAAGTGAAREDKDRCDDERGAPPDPCHRGDRHLQLRHLPPHARTVATSASTNRDSSAGVV